MTRYDREHVMKNWISFYKNYEKVSLKGLGTPFSDEDYKSVEEEKRGEREEEEKKIVYFKRKDKGCFPLATWPLAATRHTEQKVNFVDHS